MGARLIRRDGSTMLTSSTPISPGSRIHSGNGHLRRSGDIHESPDLILIVADALLSDRDRCAPDSQSARESSALSVDDFLVLGEFFLRGRNTNGNNHRVR